MASIPSDDLTHLDEPKTAREMFQKIMRMIENDRDDRADDRDMLEKFVTSQGVFNKAIDDRVRSLEDCRITNDENLKMLKEQSKKWDITNSLGVLIVLITTILTALGITGS